MTVATLQYALSDREDRIVELEAQLEAERADHNRYVDSQSLITGRLEAIAKLISASKGFSDPEGSQTVGIALEAAFAEATRLLSC